MDTTNTSQWAATDTPEMGATDTRPNDAPDQNPALDGKAGTRPDGAWGVTKPVRTCAQTCRNFPFENRKICSNQLDEKALDQKQQTESFPFLSATPFLSIARMALHRFLPGRDVVEESSAPARWLSPARRRLRVARESCTEFRVRYCETDQMGTFSSARALEWFECGRTEWLRQAGLDYAAAERRGLLLPVVEAHVEYLGRARYDDRLRMTVTAGLTGRARMRFDIRIEHADGGPVARGYTVHAFTDAAGRAIRPPAWFLAGVSAGPTTKPETRSPNVE